MVHKLWNKSGEKVIVSMTTAKISAEMAKMSPVDHLALIMVFSKPPRNTEPDPLFVSQNSLFSLSHTV